MTEKHGAPGKTRTPNLLIRSQMLYPLSYGRGDNAEGETLTQARGRRKTESHDGPNPRAITLFTPGGGPGMVHPDTIARAETRGRR